METAPEMSDVRQCADIAFAYHERTKHQLSGYAAGPETLDWDAQPDPFREYSGCPRVLLPIAAGRYVTGFEALGIPGAVAPEEFSQVSVAALLELSMGISAWKQYGPDRWAVRCNPSSGNLHPTEAYIVSHGIAGLVDGVYHYACRDHCLEHRGVAGAAAPGLWIGLSSIHWREAWKYGERAFRYCQLDIGHAIGAIRFAAATLGWSVSFLDRIGSDTIATLLGLDRDQDFANVEREDPELLLCVHRHTAKAEAPMLAVSQWVGQANRLDFHPMYRWPIIDEVSNATHGHHHGGASPPAPVSVPISRPEAGAAAHIIQRRRSAQRFDAKFTLQSEIFYRMLDSLQACATFPWDVWEQIPAIHPVLFVHRIEGLEAGLYILPRTAEAQAYLREDLHPDFDWQPLAGAPAHLPLFRLAARDYRAIARRLNCNQAIGGDSNFSVSMLAEFAPIVAENPWRYRQLHWEAGLLGQVLYLQAEAADLSGTGIGCYFDDVLHDLLGITTKRFQSLYHFTVGRALHDSRIASLPAYPGRAPQARRTV